MYLERLICRYKEHLVIVCLDPKYLGLDLGLDEFEVDSWEEIEALRSVTCPLALGLTILCDALVPDKVWIWNFSRIPTTWISNQPRTVLYDRIPNSISFPVDWGSFFELSLTFSPFSLQTEEHLLHKTCIMIMRKIL